MGLLDTPKDEALLTLGLGLLNSKGSFGNALGQAGMQSMQAFNQAKDRERVAKMQALQEEMARMNLENARRQQEQQARMEQFRASLQSPQELNIGQAMAGGGGPTLANAAKLEPVDQNQALMFGAMKAGLVDPVQYIQSQQKDNTPLSVAEGTTLLNRKTMQPIFQNARAEKDDEFVRRMKAAGIDPSSPLGRQMLLDKLKKDSTHSPAVQVSLTPPQAGVDEKGNPIFFQTPRAGGAPVVVPGVRPNLKADKDLTDAQAKANLFGTRAQEADRVLSDLAKKGTGAPSVVQQMTNPSGVAGRIATAAATPQQQQVDQAQRDFINAVLRRESGAVIADSEFANARLQYFPQPGDSAAVIAQKARNRRIATEGILAEVPQSRRGVPSVNKTDDADNSDPLGLRK